MSTWFAPDLEILPTVLIVCTGNICRSPMGEVVLRDSLLRAGLDRYSVASCGTSSEEQGNPIYPPAARVLRAAGYSVPPHRAHRGTDEELGSAGLILAMTEGHARTLRSRCEKIGVPISRIHLWREFDGSGLEPTPGGCFGKDGALQMRTSGYSDFYSSDGQWDVDDPWYSGNFDATMAEVTKGAAGITRLLLT
ncbi:MAG: low molecular weight phosphotyrosine protein phosphatase [Ancrocorticia sp.]|nr:low molecular weight phosphotyrosine protein phosphatase [Ancrocorticia sp.]MCI1895907.1 low molecular weight phosphotyrosine protein phosphatase [Ancrocorticia sp.]MCI1963682.1 low molecular weight phosphotyrosine protein phosphatase [Ancrocorticia sp.]MCI2002729.1 low molecular weight phosphotyrosine protein phosphatase [Ancrocorticia sp.]MCI2012049.1 low molecular weight phosphotyrosine protein phosphatase [Ancrocorticia sp.]